MAQKRMFDKSIIDTDRFCDMPLSAKALYFLLGMEADDYGFVSPRRVMRMHGGTDDDLKILIVKQFLIYFESGVVVITDWNKNNWLDKRRVTETEFKDELKSLKLIENKYILTSAKHLLSNGLESIEENSIEENSIEENIYIPTQKNQKLKFGKFGRIKLTKEEYQKLIKEFGENFINKQINQLDEYVESNNNKNKYTNFNLVLRKAIKQNWFKENEKNQVPNWFDKELKSEKLSEEEEQELKKILEEVTNGTI